MSDDKPIDPFDDAPLAEEYVDEFVVEKYRSLNLLAVLSGVCGLLSILTVFTWFLGLIPLTGLLLGFLALRQIDREFTPVMDVNKRKQLYKGWQLAVQSVLNIAKL